MSDARTTLYMTSPLPWRSSTANRDILTTSARLTGIPDLTFVSQTSAKKGETLLVAYCERTTSSLGPGSTQRTWIYTNFPSRLGTAPDFIVKVDKSVLKVQGELFKQCSCSDIRHEIELDQLLMGDKRSAALAVLDTLPDDAFDTIAGVVAEDPSSTFLSGQGGRKLRAVRFTQGSTGDQHYTAVRRSSGNWEWTAGHPTEPTFENHTAVLKGSIGATF